MKATREALLRAHLKAMHLHGGMGFTWEVPLHHALREVRKIDAAWGGGDLPQSLGRRFIDTCKG